MDLDTQLAHIKAHLLTGAAITPLDAYRLYGSMRLSAQICVLRHRDNMPIKTTRLPSGNGSTYASYTYEPKKDVL